MCVCVVCGVCVFGGWLVEGRGMDNNTEFFKKKKKKKIIIIIMIIIIII